MLPRQALVAISFLVYSLAGCVGPAGDSTGSGEDGEGAPESRVAAEEGETIEAMRRPESLAEQRELRRRLADRGAKKIQGLDRARADAPGTVTGEVPDDMLEKIVADLMKKIGAERADIDVLHAESLIWSDGSLGCGKPGEVYTQAVVPGYRVILGHGGQQYDYRASVRGFFMLCEHPGLAAPGAGVDPPVQ